MSKWIIAIIVFFIGSFIMTIAGQATGTVHGGPIATIVLAATFGAIYALFKKDNKNDKDDNNSSILQK